MDLCLALVYATLPNTSPSYFAPILLVGLGIFCPFLATGGVGYFPAPV